MKKSVFFLLTAMIMAACAAPPTNREATSSTNTNKPAETTTAAPLTEAEAIAKEKEAWQILAKQNIEAFSAMLADDQIYVAGDGVHDKASSVKGVAGFVPSDVTFADWKFLPIDKDAAILTYKATAKGTMSGQPLPGTPIYATTVLVNRGGKWLAIFHQESDVSTEPPPPPAKLPTPGGSPAATASPAVMTADVEANEKAVWAALIARRFDVFESYLLPEAIEVEPSGVFDRAATVKGVQQFDFSKSTLSAWKTVKIDDDASIVTYTAHFPGLKPDTEYHSSVWVNRNGKWAALFHQGTRKSPAPPAPTK